jgi:hypothetical protein
MLNQKDRAGNFVIRDRLLNNRVENGEVGGASRFQGRFLPEGRRREGNQAQHGE